MTEKKKKKLRSSRFEDSIKDYARTNSAYTDDNRKRAEEAGLEGGWKAPLNSSEKMMIAADVIALIGCVIKYVIL